MSKEELEYKLEKSQVEIASLKLRIKTIKRRRKQESAKRRLLQKRIYKAIDIIEEVLFIGVKDYRSQLEIIEDILKGSEE